MLKVSSKTKSWLNLGGNTYQLLSAYSQEFTREDNIKIKNGVIESSMLVPIEISGKLVESSTLTSTLTIGSYKINIKDNISEVRKGDIVKIISNKLWYHDPRDNAYTGELSLVESIFGNLVVVKDASNDTYQVPTENVSVEFWSAPTVETNNLTLINFAKNDSGRNIVFNHCKNIISSNDKFIDGQGQNQRFFECYRGIVSNSEFIGFNAVHTGYGSQTSGSVYIDHKNCIFSGGRRGVDHSGIIPSRHCRVIRCVNNGGGYQSDGIPYFNIDDVISGNTIISNNGFGNHGPSEFCEYLDNTTLNLSVHIIDRGRSNVVERNKFLGGALVAYIDMQHGGGGSVKNNNHYLSSYAPGSFNDSSSNKNTDYSIIPDTLIRLVSNVDLQMPMVISDNFSDAVRLGLLKMTGNFVFDNTNDRSFWLSCRNNEIQICRNKSEEMINASLIVSDRVNLFNVSGIMDFRGNKIKKGANFSGNIVVSDTTAIYTSNPDSSILLDGIKTYVKFLHNDSALKIPVNIQGSNFINIRLSLTNKGSSYSNGFLGLLKQESTIKISQGYDDNFDYIDIALTGTTGEDGKITASWVGNSLYIENRLGGSRYAYIEINDFSV